MLSKDDDTLGILVHEVAHLLRTHIDRRVEPYNLTRAKWLALGVLDRREGMRQTELADYLALDKSTVGRLIDRLEQRGFVERRRDPSDRRVYRIYFTQSAQPILTELEQVADDVRAEALRGIPPAEQEQLLSLLARVKKNLQEVRQKRDVS